MIYRSLLNAFVGALPSKWLVKRCILEAMLKVRKVSKRKYYHCVVLSENISIYDTRKYISISYHKIYQYVMSENISVN